MLGSTIVPQCPPDQGVCIDATCTSLAHSSGAHSAGVPASDDPPGTSSEYRTMNCTTRSSFQREAQNISKRFCFAFKGPKRPKGPNWVQLMNLAQASLMSFFSLTPKIIQVRICQDKQISDKRSAQLWGMLQFEFSFLICPDHICLLKCMQNAKFVASSCCYSSLDAFCITGRAAQLQLGHARMFLLRALDLDLDGLSRRNRPACDNGEGTELGSHGWPGVTQREKKNGKVMQNEKCHFYSL